MHAHRVIALRPDGAYETVATLAGPVSGLGWLPDDRLLVVSMRDKQILRREFDGRFVQHADLSDIATGLANDMVVDRFGNAYVGNFGFSLYPPEAVRAAAIAFVTPTGTVSVAAESLLFPNGMVIWPDGRTFVVAESRGHRLTAFDVGTDGTLSNRRLWADTPEGTLPDGICLDAEGAIWMASPISSEVLRLQEGGRILDRIPTRQQAIACALGGAEGRTLFVLTAESTDPAICIARRTSQLEAIDVSVPAAR